MVQDLKLQDWVRSSDGTGSKLPDGTGFEAQTALSPKLPDGTEV